MPFVGRIVEEFGEPAIVRSLLPYVFINTTGPLHILRLACHRAQNRDPADGVHVTVNVRYERPILLNRAGPQAGLQIGDHTISKGTGEIQSLDVTGQPRVSGEAVRRRYGKRRNLLSESIHPHATCSRDKTPVRCPIQPGF